MTLPLLVVAIALPLQCQTDLKLNWIPPHLGNSLACSPIQYLVTPHTVLQQSVCNAVCLKWATLGVARVVWDLGSPMKCVFYSLKPFIEIEWMNVKSIWDLGLSMKSVFYSLKPFIAIEWKNVELTYQGWIMVAQGPIITSWIQCHCVMNIFIWNGMSYIAWDEHKYLLKKSTFCDDFIFSPLCT